MSFTYPAKSAGRALTDLADSVNQVIRHDPVGRGLASWAEPGNLLEAALSLLTGSTVAIATGFYIPSAQVIETDGPPGAVALADALSALGKTVVLVVEEHAAEIMRTVVGTSARAPVQVISLSPGAPGELRALEDRGVTHIVAVERPGRAADGVCYSMRGEDLSVYTADLDRLFLKAERSFKTIGIGDGGNELGLCVSEDKLAPFWPESEPIGCRTPADFTIYAGVSNWGAYGVCAMLSAATGRFLLPSRHEIVHVLGALVRAGAVDGITRLRAETVDGLPRSVEEQTLHRLTELVVRHGVNTNG